MASHSTDHKLDVIPEFDQLRLLAIIGVMLNHVSATKLVPDLSYFSYATSPILALISGFLLFRGLDCFNTLIPKLGRRFRTLIIPYLIWTLLYFIFYQLLRMISTKVNLIERSLFINPHYDWSFSKYFFEFFVLPNPGAFWYLQNLMLALPLSLILFKVLRYRISIVPLLLIIYVGYGFHWPLYFSDRFLPFFITGLWFGLHYPHGPTPLRGSPWVHASWAGLLLLTSRLIHLGSPEVESILKFPLRLGIFFLALSALHRTQDSRAIRYLQSKTHLSFLLHAGHQMVFILLGGAALLALRALGGSLYRSLLFELALGGIVVIVSIYVIESINTVLQRYTPGFLNLLNGTRHRQSTSS